MDSQLKKGLVEMCILRYLSHHPSYGYEILTDISKYTSISESTLYTVLYRLERQGSLETYREEHDGRLRKYYKITHEGLVKLEEFKKENMKMQRLLNYIVGGKK